MKKQTGSVEISERAFYANLAWRLSQLSKRVDREDLVSSLPEDEEKRLREAIETLIDFSNYSVEQLEDLIKSEEIS